MNTVLKIIILFFIIIESVSAQKVIKILASSERANNLAIFAFDKNFQTRWESEWKDNEWIQFEFDKVYTLYGMRIFWERAAAYSYKILSSLDGIKWTELLCITNGFGPDDKKINFPNPAECKFIKIYLLERATGWGFSIFEVEFRKDKKYNKEEMTSMKQVYLEGKKFFSVIKKNGKYWFLSPENEFFISKGVNVLIPKDIAVKPNSQYYDVMNKYSNKRNWAQSTIQRLKKWGFNTIGCWSDNILFEYNLPFVVILYFSVPGSEHRLVDVFHKEFPKIADRIAKVNCSRFKYAKYLLGYFIDNELPWYGDFPWYTGHSPYLLDEYMKLPSNADGKIFLKEFFKQKYKNINEFNKIWEPKIEDFEQLLNLTELEEIDDRANNDREEFCEIIAENYFKVITENIRKYDSNHLILGARFAGSAPDGVLKACGKYCDVVSVNYYAKNMIIPKNEFNKIYKLTGEKPILITEFSFRAMENNSGNRNTKGADVTVPTQQDRAKGYEKYVTQAMNLPYIIGYHWFQYFDQSPQGRSFDGEDSNYGLVDIYDNEYKILVTKIKEINNKAEIIHNLAHLTDFSFVKDELSYAKVDNIKIKRKSGEYFADFNKIDKNKIFVWGDFDNGAFINFDFININNSKALKLEINSLGWGVGITLLPNSEQLNIDNSVNLQGYTKIEIKAMVPKGVKFQIFINESGADAPFLPIYNGINGADGESFASRLVIGIDEVKMYSFDFNKFKCRIEWGNQSGNKTINLGAIKSIDIFFPTKSRGIVLIEYIKLY